ncbi:MAG: hypothetical protein ACRCTX_26580 [Afipia sp.]
MGFSQALQGAGATASAVGAYYSAKQQKTALGMQAAMDEINARMAEASAQSALQAGQQEIGRLTLQAGQLKSQQRTALAANGVDMGTGSAAEIQASADLMKEIDKNTLEANSVKTAWGYRVQGTNYSNSAAMKRATAKGIDPTAAAVTSLLTSATQAAPGWYQMGKVGGTK